jgi:carboxylesterase
MLADRKKKATINSKASPYFHRGEPGGIGCLLIHGLTASPTEVMPIAKYLVENDPRLWVSAIRLPGHGTTPADLRRCRRSHWRQAVRDGFEELSQSCAAVHLVGVSMGAILAADLVQDGASVETLTMLAPPFRVKSATSWMVPVMKHFMPYKRKSTASIENHRAKNLFSYDCYPLASLAEMWKLASEVQDRLREIRVPTLLAIGHNDRYVPLNSIFELQEAIGIEHCGLVECPNSGHVLPHEADAKTLLPEIHEFLSRPYEMIAQQTVMADHTE